MGLTRLDGIVLHPGDPGYGEEIRGYNRLVEHQPRVVVAAASERDVIAAVRYAVDAGLSVGVLCTGHGPSVPADGVLITTRRMKGIRVNVAEGTVTAQAGVLASEVSEALAPHGRIILGGSSPDVGVVGYHLGGGLPLLGRAYGFAADRVRSMRVVTADGEARAVSSDTDPDLFWALLGARGAYGLVTSLTTQTLPLASVTAGGLWFTGENIAPAARAYLGLLEAAPDSLCTSLLFMRMPEAPMIPEPLRGQRILHLRVTSADPTDPLDARLAPLRAHHPALDTVGALPTSRLAAVHNEPPGPVTFEAANSLLGPLDQRAVDALLEHAGADGDDRFLVELRHLGGRMAAASPGRAVVGRRYATFVLYTGSRLHPLSLDEARAAQGELHTALRPWGLDAVTPAFLAGPGGAAVIDKAFTSTDLARLRAIKDRVDPTNTFRINHHRRGSVAG